LTPGVAAQTPTRIEQISIGAEPAAWRSAGFALEAGITTAGSVALRFEPGEGVLGWRLSPEAGEIDGLPETPSVQVPAARSAHPNGVTQIDHLVVFTPELERTTQALDRIGVERRRVREVDTDDAPLRQGFFRFGEVILEVVEHARVPPGPARFWGITFAVADLDASADLLGDRLGTIRNAVQAGRRIATVRREAGLGFPVALISATAASQSGYSSLRQARGSSGCSFGVRSRREK
jgi:hypothetical protein